MSIGPMSGVLGSAAGAPLSQTKGAESERAARDGATQDSRVEAEKKADAAAGIGQTEEDQGASDRDADGRRLWELPPEEDSNAVEEELQGGEQAEPKQTRDPKGEAGNQLDVTG